MAVYVRVPWRGCITIPGLQRRVSSSSRDGHNSATWTPVPWTTRRPRARDTLMLFYKHCRPMGPLLQTQAISAISVSSSRWRQKTERKCWKRNGKVRKCPVFICIKHWSRWSWTHFLRLATVGWPPVIIVTHNSAPCVLSPSLVPLFSASNCAVFCPKPSENCHVRPRPPCLDRYL